MTDGSENNNAPDVIAEVDRLSEEVKGLAVDLAMMLAKLRARSEDGRFDSLEPDFIRLVNGSVKVIREITIILNAAQNREKMVYDIPSGKFAKDRIEVKLHGVLEQTNRVLESLAQLKDIVA